MSTNINFNFKNGYEDFATLIENKAYYVDKTSFLKELFMGISDDANPLFLRPRRFGKTLNMSMIKEFCELNYQNPKDKSRQQRLFIDNGRKLAVAGDDYKELREQFMGEFPVISFSFKGIEGTTFKQALSQIIFKIAGLYERFAFLSQSTKLSQDDIQQFLHYKKFCKTTSGSFNSDELLDQALFISGTFIPVLASLLFKEYEKKVIVIIDEYDVPLQKAVSAQTPYYDKMLELIKQISVNTFKQEADPWLYKGVISGCLKIAHQSVFTDANNFSIYDQDTEPYTDFFGFTEEETEKMLCDCGLANRKDDVRKWYDGYRFGNKHIYCPWSMSTFCKNAMHDKLLEPKPYWVNTSGNDIITLFTKYSISARQAQNIDCLQRLMNGESVAIELREFTTYPKIQEHISFDDFLTMLLHTGYVTFAEDSPFYGKVKVKIPNKEIYECFRVKFEDIFSNQNSAWSAQAEKLLDFLMTNKIQEAKALINSLLKQFISIRNSGSELYYHGFMLGLLSMAAASRGIECKDETETGSGFADLVLKSFIDKTSVIIELKKGERSFTGSYDAAKAAACQIQKKNYAQALINEKCPLIYGIGIGFVGKECEIVSLGNLGN